MGRICPVSKTTIRTILTERGFRGCVAANKHLLRLVNVSKRYKFAKKILKIKKKLVENFLHRRDED